MKRKMDDADIRFLTALAAQAGAGASEDDLRIEAGFISEPKAALEAAEKMCRILREEIAESGNL